MYEHGIVLVACMTGKGTVIKGVFAVWCWWPSDIVSVLTQYGSYLEEGQAIIGVHVACML